MNRGYAGELGVGTRSATEASARHDPQPGKQTLTEQTLTKQTLTEVNAPTQRIQRGEATPGASAGPSPGPTVRAGRTADATRPSLEALFGGHLQRTHDPRVDAEPVHPPGAATLYTAAGNARSGDPSPGAGEGTSLPDPVREKMEGAFGVQFSQVRVHEGSRAAALGAIAYTQGSDIHFSPGSYDPTSRAGQELLGHELTHVVQQGAGRVSVPQGKDAPINADPALEAEADELGAWAARGEPVRVPGARGAPTKGGPIQGVFLDQALEPPRDDGKPRERDDHAAERAVTSALSGIKTLGHPKRAQWRKKLIELVKAYEAADHALNTPLAKQLLLELQVFTDKINGETSDTRLHEVAAQLAQEAKQISEDLAFAYDALQQLAGMKTRLDTKQSGNANTLSRLRNEADGRRVKYGRGRARFSGCTVRELDEVYNESDRLLAQWATIKSEKQDQDQEETKLYGMPKQGKIPDVIRRYIDEFKLISGFLQDKDSVIQNLRPIAKQVKSVRDENKLEMLKQVLAKVETGGSFPQAVVIPMGILPAEIFLRFNTEAVMDDYGAGVVHGELSHRLQWAAIIHYIQANAEAFTHSPWQLYQQMSSPPFSGGRFAPGSSMWGATVDANTHQHAKKYHSPATLNRDLLESVPEDHKAYHGHSEKFPLPERPEDYVPPEGLAKMAPIGIALSLLREERVRQELEATGEDELPKNSLDAEANGGMGVTQWSGVPSEMTSKRIREDMLGSGKFEVVEKGSNERSAFDPKDQAADPKQWMILKEK